MKDPYVYEGTSVLINKLGIKDADTLEKAESDFAILAISKLRKEEFKFNSIYDCFEIHAELFRNLYEWAGKPRTIDIYKKEDILGGKSIDYVYASYLSKAISDLEIEFKKVDWSILNSEEKLRKISYFVSEFWHIHPFREGNTRTSALMLYFLIKKSGLHINLDFLSKNGQYFRNALVLSSLYDSSKTEYLLGIVKDSTSFKTKGKCSYETIDGVEVKKYSYTNHTVNKIETIKKPEDWK